MKFGETLRSRSIPQWAWNNIDYDDLKRAIKEYTTSSESKSISIPGKNSKSKAPQEFEDAMYARMVQEDDRVDQFVRSKHGELSRRLANLDKTLVASKQRWALPSKSIAMPRRGVERYSKLEDLALEIGQELEHLDRFVSANRQAWRKILKKYKKWTASSGLEQRLDERGLSFSESFTINDRTSALARYNEILAGARTASGSSNRFSSPESLKPEPFESTVSEIQHTFEHGSEVEFDTALAVLPTSPGAGRACYWVHNDNVLQIQVLLLQYMRSRKNQVSPATPSSSRPPRQLSIHGSDSLSKDQASRTSGVIVCDELQRFADRRSSETLSDSESEAGRENSAKSAASIRYSSSGEAMLTLGGPFARRESENQPAWQTARLKRKALGSLFDNDESSLCASHLTNVPNEVESSRLTPGRNESEHRIDTCLRTMPLLTDVKKLLHSHDDVQPLVTITSECTRFAGTHNTDTSGFWATIVSLAWSSPAVKILLYLQDRSVGAILTLRFAQDTEIIFSKCSAVVLREQYDDSSSSEESSAPLSEFPFAVLTVRYEGAAGMNTRVGLLERLDKSHLTERVRGFALDTHAVAVLYKPQRMPRPYWLPLLDQDIRKVPSDESSSKSRSSKRRTPNGGSPASTTEGANGSGFSTRIESSETSIFESSEQLPVASRSKRQLRRESLRRKIHDPSRQQTTRYWNEYDDGNVLTDENAYTITIDPNAPSGFPGAATISRFAGKSVDGLKTLLARGKPRKPERRPLLGHDSGLPFYVDSDDSDLEEGEASPQYGTMRHRNILTEEQLTAAERSRDNLLSGSAAASFALSFVLGFVVFLLMKYTRRKALVQTDVGVVVGVVCSVVLGIVGIILTKKRRESVGWVWWVFIAMLFLLVVVWNYLVVTIVF